MEGVGKTGVWPSIEGHAASTLFGVSLLHAMARKEVECRGRDRKDMGGPQPRAT